LKKGGERRREDARLVVCFCAIFHGTFFLFRAVLFLFISCYLFFALCSFANPVSDWRPDTIVPFGHWANQRKSRNIKGQPRSTNLVNLGQPAVNQLVNQLRKVT
jgi:hypothetical protein